MANPTRICCPVECTCMCHELGITAQHGDHPRCPTKDGLPLIDLNLVPA